MQAWTKRSCLGVDAQIMHAEHMKAMTGCVKRKGYDARLRGERTRALRIQQQRKLAPRGKVRAEPRRLQRRAQRCGALRSAAPGVSRKQRQARIRARAPRRCAAQARRTCCRRCLGSAFGQGGDCVHCSTWHGIACSAARLARAVKESLEQ